MFSSSREAGGEEEERFILTANGREARCSPLNKLKTRQHVHFFFFLLLLLTDTRRRALRSVAVPFSSFNYLRVI